MRARVAGAALAAALIGIVYPRAGRAEEDERPRIDPDKPIQCLRDGAGRVWRVQCTPPDAANTTKLCLYAPNSEVDGDGNWTRALERAQSCYVTGDFDRAALEAQGYKLVAGIADAPYGWMRDERGRVFQVNFDLHKRLYLGAAWAPLFASEDAAGDPAPGRFAIDFGLLEYEYYHQKPSGAAFRHRVALARGRVDLAPFAARAVLFHYDVSRKYPNPLLRITTFFGKPRRHDIDVHVGAWVEAGDLEVHHAPSGRDESLWRFATAHVTWDVWRSRDLYSYVRVRGGLGLERTYVEGGGDDRQAVTPAAAVDANLTLDRDGFHRVLAEALLESPRYYDRADGQEEMARRVKAELAYELIVLAVNDQPLSLRLASGTSWRDDIPGLDPAWAFHATAGLRFSLWAPARSR